MYIMRSLANIKFNYNLKVKKKQKQNVGSIKVAEIVLYIQGTATKNEPHTLILLNKIIRKLFINDIKNIRIKINNINLKKQP